MKRIKSIVLMAAAVFLMGGAVLRAQDGPTVHKVEVVQKDGAWQLLRDGKPYFINGAGGDGSRELLVKSGGNSIRTWGADAKLQAELDQCEKLGITVTVGMWLGHVDNGFKYSDAAAVQKQFDACKKVIDTYKNHPAVLMWAVGNEMENVGKGDDPNIWKAINDIAAYAHKADPNHPTMTVIAEIGGNKVKAFNELAKDVDILGINSYGGCASVGERYKKAGGTRPYVITEFGPAGVWEIPKNDFGAAQEMTSTEKAAFYKKSYEGAVLGEKGICLGSYVFLWSHKQEATPTWFGMFLPDGSKVASVDTMTDLWSGKMPENRCPELVSLKFDGSPLTEAGKTLKVTVDAKDPENDALKVRWELQRDSGNKAVGGAAQAAEKQIKEAVKVTGDKECSIKVPDNGGIYRIYCYVSDGKGGAATANLPFVVKGLPPQHMGKDAKLPFAVMDMTKEVNAYVPSGLMGDSANIAMDPKCDVQPHTGKTCFKVEFKASKGWGGAVWMDPENDWGKVEGGYNLDGAAKLTFWARGENGGEKVNFGFGLIAADKEFHDTDKASTTVTLTKDWKQYTIDLKGKDLRCVKTGFMWSLASPGAPVVFYLDEVKFE